MQAVLLIRCGSRFCALPLEQVEETMRPLPVEPVRDAPPFVRGLAVIWGGPVPVVELSKLLGDSSSQASRYVTLRTGDRRTALAVDEVLAVQKLDKAALEKMPALLGDGARGAVEAIGTLDAQLLMVLEASRLLPEEFWRRLSTP